MNSSTMHAISIPEERSREAGMTLLLAGLLMLIAAQLLFALPLSVAPGLSAENALLYVLAGALAFKIGVQQRFQLELRELHVCFVILLLYAALTIAVAAIVVQYPGYKVVRAIIAFKARMVDQFVFFAVFFYGLQSSKSALNVLKVMLLMTALANLGALLDAWGFIDAAGLVDREDGRAQGIMGESNQSAAFIACFLPGLLALALSSRGPSRLLWLGGVFVSVVALFISASRGGVLALLLAAAWGAIHFRRYVSARAIVTTAGLGILVLSVSLALIVSKYGWLLVNRFVGDSTSSDLAGASSGRLEIWSTALAAMADSPLTFLTGFGWDVYDSMPFRFATHNHYLALWFDLGLIGLIGGTMLLVIVARVALKAIPAAAEPYRSLMIAFVIGTLAVAIATFFVNLYTPWLWFWAYAALVMRIVVNQRSNPQSPGQEVVSAPTKEPAHDAYGWAGSSAATLRGRR